MRRSQNNPYFRGSGNDVHHHSRRAGGSNISRYKDGSRQSDDQLESAHHNRFQTHVRDDNYRSHQRFVSRTDNLPDNRPKKPMRPMGFRLIQSLLENEDFEDIMFQLNNEKRGFKLLLEDRDIKADIIVLLIQLMNKISSSTFSVSKATVFEMMFRSSFAEVLINYITRLPLQDRHEKKNNTFFWKDPDDFWNNLITISRTVHDLIPASSCEVLERILKAVKFYIPIIENSHSMHISDDIKAKIDVLCESVVETIKQVKRKHTLPKDAELQVEPPDDFTEIEVYPSVIEITHPNTPFLRKNIVDRPYDSVHQYLDIQFRLLREDFVRPLREGICKYLKNTNAKKIDDIKIYPKIRFLSAESINEQNCFRIQFNLERKVKKKINYQYSKKFIFGSLLCFTSDHFQSILFGKVVERKIQDLENDQLIVGFDNNAVLPSNLYDMDFIMIESSVFFEPYFQVLNVLKKINPECFPMERYIVNVQTDIQPPEYLLNINPKFYQIEQETFFPIDWNNRKFYDLNESQQRAFQAALTQEFVVIQGPPGTGKTYLGLKIAQTLIENSSVWYENSPILVICFTNHALDQFLEGLTEFTHRIVRVGGQSKNMSIAHYNIRNKRAMNVSESVWQAKRKMNDCYKIIIAINDILRVINEGEAVIKFDVFQAIPSYLGSQLSKFSNDKIELWLCEYMNFNPRTEKENNRNVNGQANREPEVDMETDDLEEGEIDNEDLHEILLEVQEQKIDYLIDIKELKNKSQLLNNQLAQFPAVIDEWRMYAEKRRVIHELTEIENKIFYLKGHLSMFKTDVEVPQPEYVDFNHPMRMDLDSRWQLYFHWLSIYIKQLKQKKEKTTKRFKEACKLYSEFRDMADVQVMKQNLVVGMTTTGAARLWASIGSLKSPIVIVEEAAEILEAHIITSLTKHCQHLILIGDHQQLKPTAASFKIETDFGLGISLFERMILNKIHCCTLDVQHRMRPELASLICPLIYPHLTNHKSVMERPEILGVEKSLFFIDHQHPEEICNDNSKKNVHEAEFLIKLARHLILNNYKPQNITILAAYLGQMFELMKERKKHELFLQDVRIAVLDNYQGEESDIILLSLVRNNTEQKIGFLKIENRVCVALSRARNGFYVMGNMTQLSNASELWVGIKDVLNKQNAIGSHLTLQCQVHPYKFTHVQDADDFLKCYEGGCDLMCEYLLNCNHKCTRLCHVEDTRHLNYQCLQTCNKILCADPTHLCTKKCFQDCGPCYYSVQKPLECGHSARMECHIDPAAFDCREMITTLLPCEHECQKPCYIDPEKFLCPFPCETRVEPCGHACNRNCHVRSDPDHLEYKCRKNCERIQIGCTQEVEPHKCKKSCFEDCAECDVVVRKKRTICTHVYDVPCKVNVDDIKCRKPCTKSLACTHKCKNKCHEACTSYCQTIVTKVVPDCKHTIKVECSLEPDRKYCRDKCPRLLPCGHKCRENCNKPCTQNCSEMVDCLIPSPCGHVIKQIRCHLKNSAEPELLIKYCTEKCNFQLKCGHVCLSTCGDCYQGRIHARCKENCGVPLICNHKCPIPCRQNCRPCNQKCNYYCGHSYCGKRCGQPCTPCQESCTRRCEHQKCLNRCGDTCSVPPCLMICDKNLQCLHPCVGFCGDLCPTLCRICNEDTLTDIFLGSENDEGAIYVMLENCKHVFESTDLDRWMGQDELEIKAKVCPRCSTTITKSRRYNDILKKNMQDLVNVKEKSYGKPEENKEQSLALNKRLDVLQNESNVYFPAKMFNSAIIFLKERLLLTKRKGNMNRRQVVSRMDLQAIEAKIQILERMVEIFKENKYTMLNIKCDSIMIVSLIFKVLTRDEHSISDQEIDDVTMELQRLSRCVQFEVIMISPGYVSITHKPEVQQIRDAIKKSINNIARYSTEQDNELRTQLETFKKLTHSIVNITEQERKEIVGALKLTPGHWFKCQNGHPYIITECGGAMIEGECNECQMPIGGRNHQLLHGSHTSIMDDSNHAAWSEAANLLNYADFQ